MLQVIAGVALQSNYKLRFIIPPTTSIIQLILIHNYSFVLSPPVNQLLIQLHFQLSGNQGYG